MTTNQTTKTRPEQGNTTSKSTPKTSKSAKYSSKSTKNPSKTSKNPQKTPKKHQNFLHQLFGGLNITWPKLIIFAAIMGIYTALMALLVPDGNSFHDIAVTPEWWVLPAVLIIVNCKTPFDAALKVFVFFLISQPLVYLIQVPFSYMGWGLFQYYPYWFKITLATLPAGFIGWYMKKDQWYSGLILSAMTILLAFIGVNFIRGFEDSFPNHLVTVIYCFAIIPVFIFGIFKKWQPRLVTTIVTVIATIIFAVATTSSLAKYETYRNTYDTASGETASFEFQGDPYVSFWSGSGQGNVEIVDAGDQGYTLKIAGEGENVYLFSITDDTGKEYTFRYHFDKSRDTLILELDE